MLPAQKGRHCEQCDKCIVDFTQKSDKEILRAYKRDDSICGMFAADQLDRYIRAPREGNAPLGIAAAAALTLSTPLVAQNSPAPIVQVAQIMGADNQGHPETPESGDQDKPLRGRVFENASKEPLPFAEVVFFAGENNIHGAYTDLDGYFSIPTTLVEANPVTAIEVSAMAFLDVRKEFDPPLTAETFEQYVDDLAIEVEMEATLLGDVIVVQVPWYKRLWWRITGKYRH